MNFGFEMSFFQESIKKKYLNELDNELLDNKYRQFLEYFNNKDIQQNIRNAKEEQFQEGFLRELFVNIFGYTLNPQPEFNLTTELKNIANSKKVDGAILKNGDAIAVIELKGTDTSDLDKVESQAFGYKSHNPKCIYVITSNFEKIRFYIQNAVEHLNFNLFNITREQFALMWLCLAKDNLLNDIPLKMKESSLMQEAHITKKLYADYSKFREAIYNNLVKNNPEQDKLLLFKKTQKLLDRFLFVFFAEDRLLIPPNSIREIIKQWNILKDELDEYMPLYDRFKKFFGYLNTGYKGKNYEVFAYNGGLFATDEIIDNITIDDSILFDHTSKLSQYDFDTEVDVNILGHIFEHSLGEIESVQAEIKGEQIDVQKTKRKKDGIFYTPKYITKYIVENTVGKLCIEKRAEFGIIDEEYAKGRKNRKHEELLELDKKLSDYRNWLLNITILDPACGSGAFLNQALDFLITEHRKIDNLRASLLEEGLVFADITTDILENNIYGVDINEESVEIAKLSLWLRTAQIGRKLNSLSNNIKCGNSLIDDPAIAGDKAFNWEKEFPQVFGEYDVKNPPNPLKKGEQEGETWEQEKINVLVPLSKGELKGDCLSSTLKGDCLSDDWSFMKDQIISRGLIYSQYHLPYNPKLIDRAKELRKNMTAAEKKLWFDFLHNFKFRVLRQRTIDNYIIDFYIAEVKLAIEIDGDSHFSDDGIEYDKIRTEILNHYGIKVIRFNNSDVINNLEGVCNAIINEVDRLLMIRPKSNNLAEVVSEKPSNPQTQFPNPKKGFDVVIGNPPWGAFIDKLNLNYLKEKQYKDISYNTAYLFIEKGIYLLNDTGYLEFIIPKGLSYVPNLTPMRKFLFENYQISKIIDASEVFLESGVELESMIIEISKLRTNQLIQTGYICDNRFIVNEPICNKDILNDKIFAIWINSNNLSIVKKVQHKSIDLGSICKSRRGININKYVSEAISDNIVLGGRNISRYKIDYLTYSASDHIKDNFKWQLTKNYASGNCW